VANVLAAPLVEIAPTLVRRVGGLARLVLSGIPAGVVRGVEIAYTHLGMQRASVSERGGWAALVCQAS
jgi:ribosomal protein L11 methylase PrmA